MKRDWELVREILLAVEALESPLHSVSSRRMEGYDPSVVAYHIQMLMDAGLVKGLCVDYHSGNRECDAQELTWEGHEFLDRIRSQATWSKTLGLIREKGLDLSFETIKSAAGVVVTNLLT